jgi:hypothetical protein
MTTTGSGAPTSSEVGKTDWGTTTQQGASDRRAAGQSGGIVQLVRDSTYQRLGDQKERASETLGSVAGAVRGVTQQLRDGGQEQIADYANRAADGIERWATQLRQQDLQDALRGVQRFARREPAMFLGIAFGVGIVAARFLKSSSQTGDGSSRPSGGGWNPTSAGATSPQSAMGTSASPRPSTPSYVGGSPASGSDAIPRVGSDLRPAREAL